MVIVSKYEDIDAPHIEDFVYVCDKTFTKKGVIKMELKILLWILRWENLYLYSFWDGTTKLPELVINIT